VIDFEQFKLNRKPNQFLLAPADLCQNAQPHMVSPVFEEAPEILLERFRKVALAAERTKEAAADATARQTVFIAKSKIFRFPDVIDVMAVDAGDGKSALAIYSRAQIGYRDFGVNKARIVAWLDQL
jgi:uncharacterized protein (DUF1499 family)